MSFLIIRNQKGFSSKDIVLYKVGTKNCKLNNMWNLFEKYFSLFQANVIQYPDIYCDYHVQSIIHLL